MWRSCLGSTQGPTVCVQDFALYVAALDFVAEFAEDFANFVLDGGGIVGGVFELG
jgi:hypothetical protein